MQNSTHIHYSKPSYDNVQLSSSLKLLNLALTLVVFMLMPFDAYANNINSAAYDRLYGPNLTYQNDKLKHLPNHKRSSLDKGPYKTNGGFLSGSYGGGGFLDNNVNKNSTRFISSNSRRTYRDTHGKKIGTATTVDNERVIYRDRHGKRVASETTNNKGKTVYRDRHGKKIGSATTDRNGRTTYRDEHGKIMGTATPNSTGRVIYRDKKGHKIGTSDTTKDGQTIYRDRHGKRQVTAKDE